MGLRHALLSIEREKRSEKRIIILENASTLAIENVSIYDANRTITIDAANVDVRPGERVLIGKPGAGKSTLFRALAGLWPWGTGRLRLPSRSSTIFLPQKSFVPAGSLRDVLSYPADPSSFMEVNFVQALERTNLNHLVASLDHVARWDKELTVDEQQHLAFARLLVHKPEWIISDEALCHLNEDDCSMMFSLFERELAKTSVVSVTSNEAQT
jgi:putative ATP-binding cassette transporter